jgi:hypothetical protein
MRIVVVVDEDRQDCHQLKGQLERFAQSAGLHTKSAPHANGRFHVLNRIAIEELEAWFFGDVGALRSAYPRVPGTLNRRARFRDPDAINGGTWQALARVLKSAGYYRAGFPKIEVARTVAAKMDPQANTSKSFQVFREGLSALFS